MRSRTDGGDDLSDGADSDTPDSSSFFRSRFDSIIVGVFDGNDGRQEIKMEDSKAMLLLPPSALGISSSPTLTNNTNHYFFCGACAERDSSACSRARASQAQRGWRNE